MSVPTEQLKHIDTSSSQKLKYKIQMKHRNSNFLFIDSLMRVLFQWKRLQINLFEVPHEILRLLKLSLQIQLKKGNKIYGQNKKSLFPINLYSMFLCNKCKMLVNSPCCPEKNESFIFQ